MAGTVERPAGQVVRRGKGGLLRRGERGAGTLLVAAATLLAMIVAGVAVVLAAYVAAQHDAAGAADLAALAGAAAYDRGEDACSAARRVARANATSLADCVVSGDSFDFVVRVEVTKPLRPPRGLPATVTARAEAGRLSTGWVGQGSGS